MGVSRRALIAFSITSGLLLAGAGTSAAWNTPGKPGHYVSTVVADGVTPMSTLQANGTERDGNPYDVSGFAQGVGQGGIGSIANAGGPLICLDVRGNTAGGTIIITKSTDPALLGRYASAQVVDGGSGGVDKAILIPLVGPGLGCAPRPELAIYPFTSGGLVIKDGRPATTK